MSKLLKPKYLLLLVIPAIFSLFVIWKFFIVFQVPFRLDYAEGFVYLNSQNFSSIDNIYHSITNPPYVVGFYTPGYFYLTGLIMMLVGKSVAVGRVVSFISLILISFIIAVIVKRETKNIHLSILAALMFFSSAIVSIWGMITRPDILGVLFIALGIYFANTTKLKTKIDIFIVSLLLALAFFTKTHLVFATIAIFIWKFIENKRQAALFAVEYGLILSLGIIVLNLLTDGNFITQVFLYSGKVEYKNLYPAIRIAILTGISILPVLFIGLLNVIKKRASLFSIYLIVSSASFLMLLREGGVQNYLIEFILALVLAAFTSNLWSSILNKKYYISIPFIVIFCAFSYLWSFSILPWELKDYVNIQTRIFSEEKEILSKSPEKILAEDPLVALAASKEVLIEPFTFSQIVKSKLYSPENLYNDLNSGKYKYIFDEGTFVYIPNFKHILDQKFTRIYAADAGRTVKRFDYSIYDRNKYQVFGEIYLYK